MSLKAKDLPDDPALLKGVIAELDQQVKLLRAQVEVMSHRLFGRRSEKIDPSQLVLLEGWSSSADDDEDSSEEPDEPETVSPRRRRRRGGRRPLPEHLERRREEQWPSEEEQWCCGERKKRIGEDVREVLDYEPASFHVREIARIKMACEHCEEAVVRGPKLVEPIEKGLAGPGLLAHVVTSKYGDHLPLYRLEDQFLRHGVDLSRSTLCDWTHQVAELCEPIVAVMRQQVVECSSVIHTDDTSVRVQGRCRDQPRSGRFWVYLGDALPNLVVFDYTPTRERDGPARFLSDYEGYLQADAYAGYDGIYAGHKVIEVGCWAHCRRHFFEASLVESLGPSLALSFIRELYRVEREAKGLSTAERASVRQSESVPILDRIHSWLEEQRPKVLPKSGFGKAISYALRQWDALSRYTEDGRLAIDNTAAERELRRVAVGRKNWLFLGNDDAGRRAAVLLSLVSTCRREGIDPFAYLRDVLRRLPTLPTDQVGSLVPGQWARDARRHSVAA